MKMLISENDEFESRYLLEFKREAKKYGLFVNYEKDRAAIDLGLHLTREIDPKFRETTQVRVWFQLKGKQKSTLSLEEYRNSDSVSLQLSIEHLKFWYASPEPIYIALYIESADVFLVEDIRDIVLRQWGERLFEPSTFKEDQKTAVIRIQRSKESCPAIWEQMFLHSSIRIDGPSYKGRPLGHRLDPLRCILREMEASDFEELILHLLKAHDFKELDFLDPSSVYAKGTEKAKIIKGVIFQSYEYRFHLGNMIGFSHEVDKGFRHESQLRSIQGKCLVIIHSEPISEPDQHSAFELSKKLLEEDIENILVFANRPSGKDPQNMLQDLSYLGSYNRVFYENGINCMTQLLGDIAFNVLIATNVYLKFRNKIKWSSVNYLVSNFN
ncbi:DUF4365 domain-containing protein [Nodosilinea sp. PGN35]|uniref:DUF4365 domain-containing protein n=1 Tax=Nodosilinea sp. PGN35 TaxID=3020489 RepID=UPI0023B280A2|nr:DUF4365 domain-containing protein [Nodosilinea sp. TSF1-S3]MDF0365646.1 DUF4365 domain-containing protein [Nodosilinea sp. TSF1-S3]